MTWDIEYTTRKVGGRVEYLRVTDEIYVKYKSFPTLEKKKKYLKYLKSRSYLVYPNIWIPKEVHLKAFPYN